MHHIVPEIKFKYSVNFPCTVCDNAYDSFERKMKLTIPSFIRTLHKMLHVVEYDWVSIPAFIRIERSERFL